MQTTSTGSDGSSVVDNDSIEDDSVFTESNHTTDKNFKEKLKECPKRHKHIVPLANLEEFSEENGVSPVDDVRSNAVHSRTSGGSASASSEGSGSSSPRRQAPSSTGRRHGGRKRTRLKADKALNGPVNNGGPLDQHIVDMNGNGLPQNHKFHVHNISCYEDLEGIFAGEDRDGESEGEGEGKVEDCALASGGNTDCSCDLMEFAEKYFNVHTLSTPYPAAITKTVNMVRKKSLTVSFGCYG